MPYWKIALLLLASCVSAPMVEQSSVELLDGKSREGLISGGIKYSFDGKDSLTVTTNNNSFSIDPKSPSVITSSSDGRFFVLNYGNGSGQVYNLAPYDLTRGGIIDLSRSISYLIQYARSQQGCVINADEISFVFERWTSLNELLIKTEDFSRKPNCGHINHVWKLNLMKAKEGLPALTQE